MGQFTVEQRLQLSSKDVDRDASIIAMYEYREDKETGRIMIEPELLQAHRIAPGIYLITVSSHNKSLSFIRKLHDSSQKLEINVPRKLAKVIEDNTHVRVRFEEMGLDDFVETLRYPLRAAYPAIKDMRVAGNNLSVSFEDRIAMFAIRKFDYQPHIDHTGAYIIFSSKEIEPSAFKLVYDGFGEPSLLINKADGTYIAVHDLTYDPQRDILSAAYHRTQEQAYNKRFHLGPAAPTRVPHLSNYEYFSSFFQALGEDEHTKMGAVGNRAIADLLRYHGFEVVKADTVTGSVPGPDIALLDKERNKVTIEVKSTHSPERLSTYIQKAIEDLETYYFSTEEPSKGFVWKVEKRDSEYGAKSAVAVGVCFDPSTHEITIEAVRIDIELRDEQVMFTERKIDLAGGSLR